MEKRTESRMVIYNLLVYKKRQRVGSGLGNYFYFKSVRHVNFKIDIYDKNHNIKEKVTLKIPMFALVDLVKQIQEDGPVPRSNHGAVQVVNYAKGQEYDKLKHARHKLEQQRKVRERQKLKKEGNKNAKI